MSVFFTVYFLVHGELTRNNTRKSRKTKGREGIAPVSRKIGASGVGSQHHRCGTIVAAYLHIEKALW